MPRINTDVEFEVYCGICGHGICNDTDVKGTTLTVTCSYCQSRIQELENENKELEDRVDYFEAKE